MNRKQLILLIVIGVVVAGFGLYSYKSRTSSWEDSSQKLGQKVITNFPINEVERIVIKQAQGQLEDLLFKSIPVRLAELLAALADRFGRRTEQGCRIEAPLTQQTLADLIGASRQHVSGALARLAARGLIRRPAGRKGRYEIPDVPQLLAAAERP